MKLLKILENIIEEGASDILYHFVAPEYILDILENNRFNMIAAMGDNRDFRVNKNKFYYLSTTRSRSSGYNLAIGKLVLDGKKIKQRYKITPVDYFQSPKSDKSFNYIDNMKGLEQEDRIITDKPNIPNAIKYILEIHILVHTSRDDDANTKKIIELCDKYKIPIFIYSKLKNYYNQTNPMNITYFLNTKINWDRNKSNGALNAYTKRSTDEIAFLLSYNNDDLYKKITEYIGNKDDIKKFEEGFKQYREKYLEEDSKYKDELVKSVKDNISMIKSNSDEYPKFILELLKKDIRKNKFTTLKDYVNLKVGEKLS